jgi:hypothetical protein
MANKTAAARESRINLLVIGSVKLLGTWFRDERIFLYVRFSATISSVRFP